MATQADISIIIPVYNLEKYIGTTLESVVAQQGITLEVLVVDDHSTDSSKKIVEAYAEKYPFIKYIINENAKGVSGARNTALKHMTGKACFLLDGDDLLPPNALMPLFQYMNQNQVSLVRGLTIVLCNQRWLAISKSYPTSYDLTKYPTGNIWLYLYDVDFVKSNNFFFPEDCAIGEDHAFFCQVFNSMEANYRAPILDYHVYIYRTNHKKFAPTVKHALSFTKYMKHMRAYLSNANRLSYYPSCIESQFAEQWLNYAYYALQSSPEAIEQYLQDCIVVLENMEEMLAPILEAKLQGQSTAFWRACKHKDTGEMLAALQQNKLIQPFSFSYIGVDEKQVNNKFWPILKTLHRAKNLITNLSNAKNMYYIYSLTQKSKKMLSSQK